MVESGRSEGLVLLGESFNREKHKKDYGMVGLPPFKQSFKINFKFKIGKIVIKSQSSSFSAIYFTFTNLNS